MKTTLITAAALSTSLFLGGCSDAADENTSSTEANATDAAVTTQEVDIDVSKLRGVRCFLGQGWWIAFEFQGRPFFAYGADDIDTCEARLKTLKASPGRGLLTKTRSDALTSWKLEFQGSIFHADTHTPVDDPAITSTILKSGPVTIDLRDQISDLRCRITMGSWITFTYRGHEFQTYGADSFPDCETRLAQFRSTAVQSGHMTREEDLHGVRWKLALGSVFEFSSYEGISTTSAVTIDTATELEHVSCKTLMGHYVEFSYQGRTWLSIAPASVARDCDTIMAAFNSDAIHSGDLVLRNEDGGISHVLNLNYGSERNAWMFMAWEAASE